MPFAGDTAERTKQRELSTGFQPVPHTFTPVKTGVTLERSAVVPYRFAGTRPDALAKWNYVMKPTGGVPPKVL